jgi:abelson tyrosine-protein kinase 1
MQISFFMGNLQVHFNVYATPKIGKPWGAFTTEVAPVLEAAYNLVTPFNEESYTGMPVQDSKVSSHGNPWDTVLLARLRFKPDVLEPTIR